MLVDDGAVRVCQRLCLRASAFHALAVAGHPPGSQHRSEIRHVQTILGQTVNDCRDQVVVARALNPCHRKRIRRGICRSRAGLWHCVGGPSVVYRGASFRFREQAIASQVIVHLACAAR